MRETAPKDCTAAELAEWMLEVKRNAGAVMFVDGLYVRDLVEKIAEAYRIIGQREGYKKGKRDGSRAGYKVGYAEGCDDGYSQGIFERSITYSDLD